MMIFLNPVMLNVHPDLFEACCLLSVVKKPESRGSVDKAWPLLVFCSRLHQPAFMPGLGLCWPSVGHWLTFKPCHFTDLNPTGNPNRHLSFSMTLQ